MRNIDIYTDFVDKLANQLEIGDILFGGDSDEKAKWKNKTWNSNLRRDLYQVVKVNRCSVRLIEMVSGEIATLDKHRWNSYEWLNCRILKQDLKDDVVNKVNSIRK